MKKINKKVICICIIAMSVIAMINLSKSGSIISTAIIDDKLFQSKVPGLEAQMYMMLTMSLMFLVPIGYKIFYMKEKENIYVAGLICMVLMLITSFNGIAFFGSVLDVDHIEQSINLVGAFIGYLGISRLSAYICLGTGIAAVLTLFKGNNGLGHIVSDTAAASSEANVDNIDNI